MSRLRKIRYVANSCPLKRKNCITCRYCQAIGNDNKVVCHYGDKDWINNK